MVRVMHELFPDATNEELQDVDCIICRETMDSGKK